MKRILNWGLVLTLLVFIYQTIAICIPSLPQAPWDSLTALAAITATIIGKQVFESRQIASMLFDGEIDDFPFVMAALEKSNPGLCKWVMIAYNDKIKERTKELEVTIEGVRGYVKKALDNKSDFSFDISNELRELRSNKQLLSLFHLIITGKSTWEEVAKHSKERMCDNQVLKYIINDVDPEKKEELEQQAAIINKMRQGGVKVTINDKP